MGNRTVQEIDCAIDRTHIAQIYATPNIILVLLIDTADMTTVDIDCVIVG